MLYPTFSPSVQSLENSAAAILKEALWGTESDSAFAEAAFQKHKFDF